MEIIVALSVPAGTKAVVIPSYQARKQPATNPDKQNHVLEKASKTLFKASYMICVWRKVDYE